MNWTPDIPGGYEVYASFAGSDSYWPRNAVTAFTVETAAPTSSPEQAQSILQLTSTYYLESLQ